MSTATTEPSAGERILPAPTPDHITQLGLGSAARKHCSVPLSSAGSPSLPHLGRWRLSRFEPHDADRDAGRLRLHRRRLSALNARNRLPREVCAIPRRPNSMVVAIK
jgi:hypothetical protein